MDFGESKFVLLDFNGEYIGEKTITDSKKVYNLTTNRNKNNGDKETDYLNIPEERFWDKDMLSVLFGATEQTQQPFLSRVLNYYFEEEGTIRA